MLVRMGTGSTPLPTLPLKGGGATFACNTRKTPSPLEGEGWGGGCRVHEAAP
jgi:hypothetical protein